MKLTELSPIFIKHTGDSGHRTVETLGEADGIRFLCPKCLFANGMKSKGVHSIICWAPTVDREISPGPGRWALNGVNFRDLSLVAKSSSVRLTGGCKAHFYVRMGEIIFC